MYPECVTKNAKALDERSRGRGLVTSVSLRLLERKIQGLFVFLILIGDVSFPPLGRICVNVTRFVSRWVGRAIDITEIYFVVTYVKIEWFVKNLEFVGFRLEEYTMFIEHR